MDLKRRGDETEAPISARQRARLTGKMELKEDFDFTDDREFLENISKIKCTAADPIKITLPNFIEMKQLNIENSGKKTVKIEFQSSLVESVFIEPGKTGWVKLYPNVYVSDTKFPIKM